MKENKMSYIPYGDLEFKILEYYLLHYLNSGNTFIDGGAHIGQESIPAAKKIGPTGTVYAFEPNYHAAEELKRKCQEATLRNIKIIEKALFNKKCKQLLELPDNGKDPVITQGGTFADHSKNRFFPRYSGTYQFEIDCVRLDDFLNSNEIVHMIKLDVQGVEPQVLEGGEGTIQRCSPVILMEWESIPDDLVEFTYDFLKKYNYDIYDLNQYNKKYNKMQEMLMASIPQARTNLLCLPESAVFENIFTNGTL
jgi:FkbM family methyltransferase